MISIYQRLARMKFLSVVLLVLPVLVAANLCNTIFVCFTFGVGGLVNQCIAQPKCDDGLTRLGLQNSNCGCIADVESWPSIKGVAGCSSGVFCIQGDLCGDARFSMTFKSGGALDTSEELYSYFATSSPSIYEIRIIAQPQDSERFGSCSATIDSTNSCQSCSICEDGITFSFDCSNVNVDGGAGPVVSNCLNFMFENA